MVADYLRDMNPFTSSILIISPLQSLMLDQVAKLRDIDINAAAIYSDQSEEVLKDIEEGGIFASGIFPDCFHLRTSPRKKQRMQSGNIQRDLHITRVSQCWQQIVGENFSHPLHSPRTVCVLHLMKLTVLHSG